MKSISLFVLSFLVLLTGQVDTVRFFRSEEDFRRNMEITERQIGWKPYLEVRYSRDGDVLSKASYRKKGVPIQFEWFQYDSITGVLTSKTVLDQDSTLLETYLFGPGEPMSEKFIRHVYGLKRVQDFDDRFTSIEYESGDRPKVYRFFDVNGFLYGAVKLSYDDQDRLRQEDWEGMPGHRLVRRLLYGYDSESRIRDIWEYDSARVLVMHLPIDEQGMASLFHVTSPRDSFFINQPVLSYSLVENLTEGRVVWEWERGKADPGSPRTLSLAEEEMQRGDYPRLLVREAPLLVDGAVYSVRFTGRGESGFPARELVFHHVTYDETPPTYEIDSSPVVNVPELSLTLHESLARAEILWVWERGRRDPNAPHVVELSGEAVEKGVHESVSFGDRVDLNDGTVYSVFFQGTDLAGNRGPAFQVSGIRYDTLRPEFVWVKPGAGEHVSAPVVSYSLSEELASGELVWEWREGIGDPQTPHTVPMVGSELKAGKHPYLLPRNAPELVDGAVYDVWVHGSDLAGNPSDSLVIAGVSFDQSPPKISAFLPLAGLVTNRPEFITSFSEDLSSARVNWQRMEEDTAMGEALTASLDTAFLTRGDHRFELRDIVPQIEEGVSYRVTITARDLAANEADPVVIPDVFYDFTAPVITGLYPVDSSFVSSKQVSYVLSEPLRDGVVVWTQVGGETDPGSPHITNLTGEELAGGRHDTLTLSESPDLRDGSIYDLSLTGTDTAGNVSESAVARHIVYDSTPPEIELVYPLPGTRVSTAQVGYRLSEMLKEATVTWNWTGGNRDDGAPHEVELVGQELASGDHDRFLLLNSPELVDGAVYAVVAEGRDLGLKPASPSEVREVTFDTSRPRVAITWPEKGTPINSSQLRYSLSEPLSEATVIWTQTGGRTDPFSPHTVPLEGEELAPGEHGDIPLVNSPILMDSSVYDIMILGVDLALNRSDTMLVGNILFDKTPPSLEVSYPVAYSPVRNLELEYLVTERLAEGSVSWKRTGGTPDEVGEHVIPLTDGELEPGKHPRTAPISAPPRLTEGGVYTLIFRAKDRAGNEASAVHIPGLIFDDTAPRFTGVSPASFGHVNSPRVTYTLSETLERGTVVWERTGGKDDPRSPHEVSLMAEELNRGPHDNILLAASPVLEDSSLYSITFVGSDAAENVSDTLTVREVLYDVTAPRMEVTFPPPNGTVGTSRVTYRLSEALGEGTVTWRRVDGAEDVGSPHVQSLSGDELLAGLHREMKLINPPDLVEGSVYEVMFSGKDRAGNLAEPVTVPGVAFDATAPVIANVFPDSGAYVNHTQVSYSLSEFLESGTIT
ncbi:MAG: hypothetical protein ACE5HZ_06045, partial [Fidelibacterota bacterium]